MLQEKCGIQPKLPVEIEREQLEELIKAVKEDPAGQAFPQPEDVIIACLEESITIK